MGYLLMKYLSTAAAVVLISELAKRSDKLGGLVAALPLITIMTLVWLYVDHQSQTKIANHAWYTFWYVLPTLPMFLLFPWLLPRLGFWLTLAACALITIAAFALLAWLAKPFGLELM